MVSWFAMRVTYNREFKAKEFLDKAGLENYLPVRETIRIKSSRKVKERVPVVRGLIFVHGLLSDIQEIKARIPYLQYIVDRRSGNKIIVPDRQMDLFISVTSSCDDKLLYFTGDELNLSKGQHVRIIGGEFDGYEGVFLKVKGASRRCFVVAIEGVVAVALASVSREMIEVI